MLSRQDTATFTLKCGDCGKGLTGEKAALERAWRLSRTR